MAAIEMARKSFSKEFSPTNRSLDFVGVISLKCVCNFRRLRRTPSPDYFLPQNMRNGYWQLAVSGEPLVHDRSEGRASAFSLVSKLLMANCYSPVSLLPLHQIPCQFFQRLRALAEAVQFCECRADQRIRLAQGFINPEQRRVGCFLRSGIFARSFAELLGGLSYVENVVDNLKRQADRLSKRSQLFCFAILRSGIKAAADQARRDQGGGLGAMDVLQHLRGGLGMLGFEINHLSANHALHRARSARDLFDNFHSRLGGTLTPRRTFIGLCLKRISCQNCECISKNFVAGGTAAPQIVVVQRGKIVVD